MTVSIAAYAARRGRSDSLLARPFQRCVPGVLCRERRDEPNGFLSNEATAKSVLTQLRIIAKFKLVKNVSVMSAYRLDAERKLPRNLLDRASLCDPQKNFKLPRRERVMRPFGCRIEGLGESARKLL